MWGSPEPRLMQSCRGRENKNQHHKLHHYNPTSASSYGPQLVFLGTVPYLEYFSISVQNINCDLDVLLNTLPSSLKFSSLQRQVQVVPDVTWDEMNAFN